MRESDNMGQFPRSRYATSKAVDWIQDAVVPALVKLEKNDAMFANIGG
jgi:hypothetical protein